MSLTLLHSDSSSVSGEEEKNKTKRKQKVFLLAPVYMGSSDSSLSLSSSRDDSVRTGLVGDAGVTGGEGETGEEVEGEAASSEAPPAPSGSLLAVATLLGEPGSVSHPGAPREDEAFPRESSLDSILTSSPSLRLPSPQRSLSLVGEEGVDEGGWCFLAFRLASLKLARGGRSRTPLRVEPSIAFCNCKRRWAGGVGEVHKQRQNIKERRCLFKRKYIRLLKTISAEYVLKAVTGITD